MTKLQGKHKFTLPLYSGGENESNMILHKEQFLMQLIRKHKDIIDTRKHYPIKDVVEVELSVDHVILSVKEYEVLLKQATNE